MAMRFDGSVEICSFILSSISPSPPQSNVASLWYATASRFARGNSHRQTTHPTSHTPP